MRKKPIKVEVPLPQLSALEMAHLAAFDARAQSAKDRLHARRVEAVAMRATLEANVLKLQEQHRQAEAKLRQEVDDLEAAAERTFKEHDDWTRQLAAKYGVSWADSAYNELTGVLTPAPKE